MEGSKRPFYLIIIGSKELLGKFNAELEDISTFKPEKSLHFGLSEDPITKFDILAQVERSGSWMPSSKGLTDIEISPTEPLQFCVALNLQNLPLYAKDITYLQNNLKIDANGCETKYEVKEKAKLDKSKLKSEPQIALFEKATHTIIFKVPTMPLSEANIHVSLPLQYDTWYVQWSCMDDRDVASVGGQTFALEYLIDGIKEAYETKNKNYIDFSLKLNK